MTPFHFEKTGAGWLADVLPELRDLPSPPEAARIESRAQASNSLGPRPLWSGYRSLTNYPTDTKGTRSSNDVRSAPTMGRFFAWIAAERKPDVIVEFGTAFGVSGMYWLAGLNAAATGTLFTFEPNADWASIADANLSAISHRYRLTVGTFEDHVASTLDGRGIDIAFVDAIAAHPTLPLPCYVRVTNLANGRSMVVRVNDRGPFTRGRVIDVSSSVAELLDFKRAGTTRVQVKYVGPADVDGNDRRMLLASYQGPGARGTTEVADGRPGVILASAPAARSRPAIDFGIADPGPDNGSDDALAPFVLRAGFASSYAAPNPLTPAQSAAAKLAAGAADAPARPVPAIIQLGSFSDPDNADRTQRMFERYGKVVVVDRLSNSGALRSVRVVIEDPAIRPETVIAAAEAAGLTGAYLVKR